MEESVSDEQKKANKEAGDELVNCVMKFMGLTKKPKLPNFPINKKAGYFRFFAVGIARHFLGLKTPSITALNNVQTNSRQAATMCQ